MDPDSRRPGRPLLYYAMGGGLGHLTRALAVAAELDRHGASLRILASSSLAPLVMASSGFPIDHIAGDKTESRQGYYGFLSDYIERHQFKLIILDAFPFGIVGEFLALSQDIPRVLIARSLRWGGYADMINLKAGGHCRYPSRSLIIEPLDGKYEAVLKEQSDAASLDEPILDGGFCRPDGAGTRGLQERCAVIHSGDGRERDTLIRYANDVLREEGISAPVDTVFPDRNIYPADDLLASYRYVVSGAGYNMAARASQAGPSRRHYLYPFDRKFDDQHGRKMNIESGLWKNAKPDGARKAARWIMDLTG
ncbi:MAG: hypothetical protein KA369_04090 [Spirochaetes bacterium]|nr:hypothetical protein [Spirochaetota bacterium]